MRCSPKYQWGIDEARYTPATIMMTAGRVVIVHNPRVIADVIKNPVDAIDIAAFTLSQIVHLRKSKALWRPNYFDNFLSALADGRYA